MITLAYINYWKDPHNDNYFTEFIKHNIDDVRVVNHKDNPDILISSCMGNINDVKNTKARCKIFYYGENLNRFAPYNNFDILEHVFDLIVGFKYTNFDKKIVRFPLWLMYYPFYSWDETHNILNYIQTKYIENVNKNKTLFATMVARHDRGGQRTVICNELEKYGKITSSGTFRSNHPPIGKKHDDKIQFVSQSIFNICPENSCYEGYFTEKIFQAFESGTIPMYWAIDKPEPLIINENKYCFCRVNNSSELKNAIRDTVSYPEKYISGDLFKDTASEEIKRFYSELKENIVRFLHIN